MLQRNWRSLFVLLTITADTIAMGLAALAAVSLSPLFPNVPQVPISVLVDFSVFFAVVLLAFGLLIGLYRGAFHLSNRKQNLLASRAYVYALLVVLSSFYIFKMVAFPRRFTVLFFFLLPGIFAFGRLLLNEANIRLQKRGFGLHRVLLAGYDGEFQDILERFAGVPELGYKIRGIVHRRRPNPKKESGVTGGEIPAFALKDLDSVVSRERIDCIFVPSPSVLSNRYASILDVCRARRVKLKILSKEHDRLLNLARVYDIAGVTLYAPPRFHFEPARKFVKRAFDIVGSLSVIVVLSPIFVGTAVLIAIESGFPVSFKQQRTSVRGGKTFGFIKFRSMVRNADELKADLMKFNEADGALFKMKNDPRITRVGRFIRKYSIDELPQLFNVLKGDMSLVGPRPLPVKDIEIVNGSDEFWESIKDSEKVKPGMTGLWQISGRSNIGFRDMVLLDLYYIENQGILFDLEILFETIPVVLFGKGAY